MEKSVTCTSALSHYSTFATVVDLDKIELNSRTDALECSQPWYNEGKCHWLIHLVQRSLYWVSIQLHESRNSSSALAIKTPASLPAFQYLFYNILKSIVNRHRIWSNRKTKRNYIWQFWVRHGVGITLTTLWIFTLLGSSSLSAFRPISYSSLNGSNRLANSLSEYWYFEFPSLNEYLFSQN